MDIHEVISEEYEKGFSQGYDKGEEETIDALCRKFCGLCSISLEDDHPHICDEYPCHGYNSILDAIKNYDTRRSNRNLQRDAEMEAI